MIPIWLDNFFSYVLQIAGLILIGALLAYAFRLRVPRLLLSYWQILLLACLLLPCIQTWKHPEHQIFLVPAGYTSSNNQKTVLKSAVVASTPEQHDYRIDFTTMIPFVLGGGVCLRLFWLAIGLMRLKRLRDQSRIAMEYSDVMREMKIRNGPQIRIYISGKIATPIAFGLFSPAIILPDSFRSMSESHRKSIICHELLHIQRRDWVFIIGEELIRAVFWFHPALWYLIAKIHVAREQVIDSMVVRLMGSKKHYMESLLEIAQSYRFSDMFPASLLLKRNHLTQRIKLLIKEPVMSKSKAFMVLFGAIILLYGEIVFSSSCFPLIGSPVYTQKQIELDASRYSLSEDSVMLSSEKVPAVNPISPDAIKVLGQKNQIHSIIIKIKNSDASYAYDVLNGMTLELEASDGKRYRSSPVVSNHIFGETEFRQPIPPGNYKLISGIFNKETRLEIPPHHDNNLVFALENRASHIEINPVDESNFWTSIKYLFSTFRIKPPKNKDCIGVLDLVFTRHSIRIEIYSSKEGDPIPRPIPNYLPFTEFLIEKNLPPPQYTTEAVQAGVVGTIELDAIVDEAAA